LAKIKNQEEI